MHVIFIKKGGGAFIITCEGWFEIGYTCKFDRSTYREIREDKECWRLFKHDSLKHLLKECRGHDEELSKQVVIQVKLKVL